MFAAGEIEAGLVQADISLPVRRWLHLGQMPNRIGWWAKPDFWLALAGSYRLK